MKTTPEELAIYRPRFWGKVSLPFATTDEDCWDWIGASTNGGYGLFWFQGRSQPAHRVGWVLFKGEIHDKLEVCHRCDSPSCVNPSHMFLATHQDNLLDCSKKNRLNNDKAKRDHCVNGHPYSPENLQVYISKDGYPYRRCKRCASEQQRIRLYGKRTN